ncbi:hypothetical protein LguiB_006461 [Lonicera macranthoides]
MSACSLLSPLFFSQRKLLRLRQETAAEVKPPSVLSPFGTLPEMPQQSIALRGSTPSLKYGISSLPVSNKQASVRVSSSLTVQHLSQRRNRLPVQKYDPKSNGRKVPFFSDELPTPAFIPRENPRALVIRPSERWPLKVNLEKISPLKCSSIHASNENSQDDAEAYAPVLDGAIYQDEKGNSGENSTAKSCATESASAYANLTALLPKLHKCSDYYTVPQIQELASKERAEPGSISRVKDFILGRRGYGSIKFLGSTDVRQLDLESLIQFNSREVIVYPDESKKHPVGQGLNKPAEVTLLNIKYIDKRTGKQYVDGPKADKYREMLIKKATDQGAEFVSYDPVVGEWKFRSSSSPFGSPSIFGLSQNPGNNQFSPKPFGSPMAFGAPMEGSIFGETSTSIFGATSSSASSTFFGSSMPAFGCSSFSFGGSSIFGAKPAFGPSSTTGFGFSSTPSFGQPTVPAVSSSFLGTTQSPFGTQSSPSGGQARILTLGSTGFGQSISSEKCGSRVLSYKQTVVDEGGLVSVSGMPVYNDKSHEELRWEDYQFGDKGSLIFGANPTFGASSTTGFGFRSTPSFGGPTIPAVSNSFLETTQSPFGTHSSPSGGQARILTLGSTGFGQSISSEKCGSRVLSYKQTVVDEGGLVSVSGMPVYNDKSHEELRWEDYQFGDKGSSIFGAKPAFGASSTTGFGFSSTPSFGQPTIPAVSSSFHGITQSPFGTQSSPSGKVFHS